MSFGDFMSGMGGALQGASSGDGHFPSGLSQAQGVPPMQFSHDGLGAIIAALMAQGNPSSQPAPAPAPKPQMLPGTDLAAPQPLASASGPSIGQAAAGLPTMDQQQPSFMSGIGGALAGASGGGNQRFMSGLGSAQGAPPMQFGHAGLQSILQQLGVM